MVLGKCKKKAYHDRDLIYYHFIIIISVKRMEYMNDYDDKYNMATYIIS